MLFFTDVKKRAIAYQVMVLLALLALITLFVTTAIENLSQQGMTSGFDFLNRTVGWDAIFTIIDYDVQDDYKRVLFVGFLNTLFVGSFCIIFATLLGTVIGLMRTSEILILRVVGTLYVETFRNVPLLLQAIMWYLILSHLPAPRQAPVYFDAVVVSSRGLYIPWLNVSDGAVLFFFSMAGLIIAGATLIHKKSVANNSSGVSRTLIWGTPFLIILLGYILFRNTQITGEPLLSFPTLDGLRFVGGMRVLPEFAALAFAIILYGGAYIGEIIRNGIQSVSKGQIEAAVSLGLSYWQVKRDVHLPLALRAIVPPMSNQFVGLIKATTIGIGIGFSDFFMISSTAINQSGQTLEILLIMMLGYFVINFTISTIMNAINRKIAIVGHG